MAENRPFRWGVCDPQCYTSPDLGHTEVPATGIQFADFELDPARYELRRAGRTLKLEKIPMELLILLLEKDGHLVTRQQIIERLWGNDVFVDTEHGINTAIRKIRQALKDDPDQPRFVQTVTGKGYRFVAAVANVENGRSRQTPSFAACVGPEAGTLSPDHLDGGAIPISPLQRAAGRFSAAPLRNIVLGTAVRIFLALLIVAWSRGWLNRSFVRASTVNRPVRGSAASRQPLWGPGARLLRRRHDG